MGARTSEANPKESNHIKEPAGATRWLLVCIAVVVVAAALKLAASVFVPLVFSLFLIAVFWPLYAQLSRRIPASVAAVVTFLALLASVGVIGGALWYSGNLIAGDSSGYGQQLTDMREQARGWARERGLPVGMLEGPSGLKDNVREFTRGIGGALTGAVLAAAFFVLGLLEVREYKRRVRADVSSEAYQRFVRVFSRIAKDFQRYIVVRTGIGLLTGIAVAIAAWLIGLDFAFIWGLANFLLNYIPTLGSIVGVVPPTLFALVQFQDFGMALVTLATVGGVQLLMGNIVDPLVQGKYLKLSPVVVLFSVVFWGWTWGIAGALIAVPLTVLIVLTCREFPSTRFIAHALAAVEMAEEDAQKPEVTRARAPESDRASRPDAPAKSRRPLRQSYS